MQVISTKYTTTIAVSKSPKDVFNFIIDLKKWWVEEFIGEELKLNSEFELKIGEGHHSKNKVIEFVPGKKFTWITTESLRVADNFDWTGTKMIFELSRKDDGTLITFTYDGVVFEGDKHKLKEICDYCIKNLLYNHLESFTATIEVSRSPQEVFNCLTQVTNWWNSEDFEGKSKNLYDEFIINHPNQHYSKQKLIEVVPDRKIVWLVTESNLTWIKNDKEEWTNTKMIFDITANGDKTILHFTHEGLTPEKECYAMCEKGWTLIITDWLFHFITFKTPSKEMTRSSEIRNQALKDDASFHSSFMANISAKEAFEGICKVNEWWGHIEGKTEKLNDVFTYRPNDTWVNFKITECNEKKIVWHVNDCFLHFQNDKTEWTNTDVIFTISETENMTQINFTHVGLVPEAECYENCKRGWTHYIKTSLLQFLTTGKGQLK